VRKTLLSALAGHPDSTRFWRITLVGLVCVIAWLALSPAPPKEADLGWDKLNHLAAFASLAAVAFLGRVGVWVRIALALLAYGALIEVLQSFTATRSAEWGDLLADGVGIASGLLLASVVAKLALRLGGQRA
jgi:VanZ family protein